MPKTALHWKVTGAAGEGVKSTGLLFSKTCLRLGLCTFDYTDYPSLIRGGHNTYQVHASPQPIHSQFHTIDVLVTLNQNGLTLHLDELATGSIIIADIKDLGLDASSLDSRVANVPLYQLATDAGGQRLMANNVALGVSVWLFQLDLKVLEQAISQTFSHKGKDVISANLRSAQAGYEYAQAHLSPISHISIPPSLPHHHDISLTGNEALSLGSLAGGMKAFFAYPMTPASSILHTLAEWAKDARILVKHAEDEIGVINMALGASFAGVRTGIATSGGGFTYMTEALGLSGIAELPLVIFEAQRPGPALGMPTWTAQADLLFTIFASQDEFPRVVLAPGDVDEAFSLAKLAFEIAEAYQLPVIVLSDKHLSESGRSAKFDTAVFSHQQTSIDPSPKVQANGFYPRYALSENGVSLRTIPGQKDGFHLANSYEADIYGLSSESADVRTQQMQKRMHKLISLNSDIPAPFYQGSDHPQITFIGFGSAKGALVSGAQLLQDQGIDAAVLNLSWLWPFPAQTVTDIIHRSQCPVIIEGNYTCQLAKLIKQETGIDIYHKRTRYDGRPFYPHQIVDIALDIL